MPDTHDTHEGPVRPSLAPRDPAPAEVLRARPGKSKLDHAELSREFIARFPKIRARLAE